MSLRTGLLAALAYVLLLAIVALGVPLASSLSARVNDEVRSQAQGQADLVAATAADLLSGSASQRARRADPHRRSVRARARDRRRPLGDRARRQRRPGPARRQAMPRARRSRSALAGHRCRSSAPSRTLGEEILATAVPIIRNGAPVGAVRVTQSVAAVHAAVRRVELGLALIGVVVLALGLAVGAVIAGQIARPLGRLERVARRVAGGDLSARATIEGSREQRSLGESFNEMTDRVQRLLDSQRAFVADASHQLRTPLTGLRLRIEEARAIGVSPPAAVELDAGAAEVDRLAQIVEELLVLSRAGERELPGESLDLRAAIERALMRWRAAAAEREIGLESGELLGGAVWCAAADADRALDVLVENALCYAPHGSRVTLASAPGRIEVRDRGPGLAAEDGESIFERFHRGSAGRAGPAGSGLGLAIARELAREWGGEVTLRNRKGGGAVATLTLPERRQ